MEKFYDNYNIPRVVASLVMAGLIAYGSYIAAEFTEDFVKPKIERTIEKIVLQNKK